MKISINIELSLCYWILIFYIVGGSALTINLGVRLPLKVAEIMTIPYIFLAIKKGVFMHLHIFNYEKFILMWVLWGTISALLNNIIYQYGTADLIYGLFYSVRIIHIALVAHFMVLTLYKNRIQFQRILQIILKLYTVLCFIGFAQLILFPVARDFYQLFYDYGFYFPNPDPHVGRLISTYFDPNYLASCLVIPFTISLYTFIYSGCISKTNIFQAAFFALTIVLTVSRSGFLGMFIVCVLPFLHLNFEYQKAKRLFLLLIIISIIVTLVLIISPDLRILYRIIHSSTDASTTARIQSWEASISMIKENLVLGIGYNLLGAYRQNVLGLPMHLATSYGSDSSLLLIITSTGFIGVLFLCVLIIKVCKRSLAISNHIMNTILIASLVIANFNNLLFYTLWLFPILFLLNLFRIYDYPIFSRKRSHILAQKIGCLS